MPGSVDCHIFYLLCPQTVRDAFVRWTVTCFIRYVHRQLVQEGLFVHRNHKLNKQQVHETQKRYAYLGVYSQFVLPGFVDQCCHMSYSLCPQWWIVTPPYLGLIYSICPQTVRDTRVGGLSPDLFTMSTDSS